MLAFKSNSQNFSIRVLFLVCLWFFLRVGVEGGREEQGKVQTSLHVVHNMHTYVATLQLLCTSAEPNFVRWCFA